MIFSEVILILFTLSELLRFSNLAIISASTFLDSWRLSFPPAPVIFLNELPVVVFSPPNTAGWVLDRTCLFLVHLRACGGVRRLGDEFSTFNFVSFLVADGVHEAGLIPSAFFVGVVCTTSLLATPPPASSQLSLASSMILDRRGEVLQLAALAESAYMYVNCIEGLVAF